MEYLQEAIGLLSQVEREEHINPEFWGVLGGVIQVFGYTIYYIHCVGKHNPNPLSWLMFTIDTGFFTFMEWDAGAAWYLLVLPLMCSVSSFVIALLVWKSINISRLSDEGDWWTLTTFTILLVAYLSVENIEGVKSYVSEEQALQLLILLSNAATVVAFVPIVRDARDDPHSEFSPPWVVWTLAYVCLGVSTFQEDGLWTIYMVYPASCAILHGIIAWLARPSLQRA
jgi:hypothetical protein